MLSAIDSKNNLKTTEHYQNIAIKFLDIDSRQSRRDSPFLSTKKHKPQPVGHVRQQVCVLIKKFRKIRTTEP